MTVTLYKNTQTEGDAPKDVYENLWQLSPYIPASMFCRGETTEKAEFIIPEHYNLIKNKGRVYFARKGNDIDIYDLLTNNEGRPFLKARAFNCPPALMYRTGEKQPEAPSANTAKNKPMRWIPGEDENGELEIF